MTATELSGKKVQFLTGVNYHEGERVSMGEGWASVWGVHPANVSPDPNPVGAAILYNAKKFESVTKTENMVRLVSFPASSVSTKLIGASTKEAELNSAKRFEAYVSGK